MVSEYRATCQTFIDNYIKKLAVDCVDYFKAEEGLAREDRELSWIEAGVGLAIKQSQDYDSDYMTAYSMWQTLYEQSDSECDDDDDDDEEWDDEFEYRNFLEERVLKLVKVEDAPPANAEEEKDQLLKKCGKLYNEILSSTLYWLRDFSAYVTRQSKNVGSSNMIRTAAQMSCWRHLNIDDCGEIDALARDCYRLGVMDEGGVTTFLSMMVDRIEDDLIRGVVKELPLFGEQSCRVIAIYNYNSPIYSPPLLLSEVKGDIMPRRSRVKRQRAYQAALEQELVEEERRVARQERRARQESVPPVPLPPQQPTPEERRDAIMEVVQESVMEKSRRLTERYREVLERSRALTVRFREVMDESRRLSERMFPQPPPLPAPIPLFPLAPSGPFYDDIIINNHLEYIDSILQDPNQYIETMPQRRMERGGISQQLYRLTPYALEVQARIREVVNSEFGYTTQLIQAAFLGRVYWDAFMIRLALAGPNASSRGKAVISFTQRVDPDAAAAQDAEDSRVRRPRTKQQVNFFRGETTPQLPVVVNDVVIRDYRPSIDYSLDTLISGIFEVVRPPAVGENTYLGDKRTYDSEMLYSDNDFVDITAAEILVETSSLGYGVTIIPCPNTVPNRLMGYCLPWALLTIPDIDFKKLPSRVSSLIRGAISSKSSSLGDMKAILRMLKLPTDGSGGYSWDTKNADGVMLIDLFEQLTQISLPIVNVETRQVIRHTNRIYKRSMSCVELGYLEAKEDRQGHYQLILQVTDDPTNSTINSMTQLGVIEEESGKLVPPTESYGDSNLETTYDTLSLLARGVGYQPKSIDEVRKLERDTSDYGLDCEIASVNLPINPKQLKSLPLRPDAVFECWTLFTKLDFAAVATNEYMVECCIDRVDRAGKRRNLTRDVEVSDLWKMETFETQKCQGFIEYIKKYVDSEETYGILLRFILAPQYVMQLDADGEWEDYVGIKWKSSVNPKFEFKERPLAFVCYDCETVNRDDDGLEPVTTPYSICAVMATSLEDMPKSLDELKSSNSFMCPARDNVDTGGHVDIIGEFVDWLDFNICCKYRVILVAFNGAKFDHIFLTDKLAKRRYLIPKTVMAVNNSVLTATTWSGMRLWDLSKILIGSLDSCCRSFKTSYQKVSGFDHHLPQKAYQDDLLDQWVTDNYDKLREYNFTDCLALLELTFKAENAARELSKELTGKPISITNTVTASSFAWKIYDTLHRKSNPKVSKAKGKSKTAKQDTSKLLEATIKKLRDEVTPTAHLATSAKLDPLPEPPKTYKAYKEIRSSLIAGRTQNLHERPIKLEGNFTMLDISSSYPNVMRNEVFPTGECVETSHEVPNCLGVYRCVFDQLALLDKKMPDGRPFPTIIPLRLESKALNWSYYDEIECWLTTPDIESLRSEGVEVDVFEGYYWTGKTSNLFKDYIDPIYALKQKLDSAAGTPEANPAKREFCKLLMNALSGKVAEKCHCFSVSTLSEDAYSTQTILSDLNYASVKYGFGQWGNAVYIEGKVRDDRLEDKYMEALSKGKVKPAVVAGYIYAYARRNLYRALKYGGHYCDTDSVVLDWDNYVKFRDDFPELMVKADQLKQLGQWEMENVQDGTVPYHFYAIAPKQYALIPTSGRGKGKIRTKGISSRDLFIEPDIKHLFIGRDRMSWDEMGNWAHEHQGLAFKNYPIAIRAFEAQVKGEKTYWLCTQVRRKVGLGFSADFRPIVKTVAPPAIDKPSPQQTVPKLAVPKLAPLLLLPSLPPFLTVDTKPELDESGLDHLRNTVLQHRDLINYQLAMLGDKVTDDIRAQVSETLSLLDEYPDIYLADEIDPDQYEVADRVMRTHLTRFNLELTYLNDM